MIQNTVSEVISVNRQSNGLPRITDYGNNPLIINIDRATKLNENFRTALWTGEHLQVTLMSIPVGGEIGLEIHQNVDQFLRIESGYALVMMGRNKNTLNYRKRVNSDYAVIVPSGIWHNIVNIGNQPLKIYSIYAPPQHPFETVHRTKADADKAEHD
ncbi:MAG: cupin domain-containing protein [Candidatus Fimenecus sp.]